MGTKGVKKGPKGGAKRHISKVKRANQKMNKLVKKGKAKPKGSQPRYIPNGSKKTDNKEKEAWLTPEVRKKWQRKSEPATRTANSEQLQKFPT